jgi:micrococcal nuclease
MIHSPPLTRSPAVAIAVVFVVLLTAACRPPGPEFTGRVVRVVDGDTLEVMKGERAEKVRLWGIDAPEHNQDWGSRSKQMASSLAFGREVTVRERDRDRYGRTVGEVVLPDGKILNEEMVRAGLAWWYRRHAPDSRVLKALEEEARAARRGLWGDPRPVPPWEYRGRRRAGEKGSTPTRSKGTRPK